MNLKKLNEEIEEILDSNNPILDRIKKEYPENIEEDLTEQYKDYVIQSLQGLLKPDEKDTYLETLKIFRSVTHFDNSSYIRYTIFGYYGTDRVISGRMGVKADTNGNTIANETIFAGFTRNPIGKIQNRYTFNPDMIFQDVESIIVELTSEMERARKQSLSADQAYMDYVARTGDLS